MTVISSQIAHNMSLLFYIRIMNHTDPIEVLHTIHTIRKKDLCQYVELMNFFEKN